MRSPTATAVLAAAVLTAAPALAQDFVYQGSLSDNNQPADGLYDLTFEYYTAISGGAALQTATRDDVQVTDGVFQVSLPMPPSDDARFLELAVRDGASTGGYTQLLPRTFIASTPYATKALNVEWDRNMSDYLTFGDGNEIVLINRQNRIGAEYFGVGADTDSFGGMYVSTSGSAGLPFYGYDTGFGADAFAYHYLDGATNELRFVIDGFTDNFVMRPNGDLIVEDDLVAGGSVTAEDFSYESPQTRYFSVSGNTFTPGNNIPYEAFTSLGSGLYPDAAVSQAWYLAPINLPDGAVITELQAALFDNLNGSSVRLNVLRQSLTTTGNGASTLAVVDTAGLAASPSNRILTDTTIQAPVIDNQNFSYFFFAFFINPTGNGNDVRLASARLSYTVDSPD